MKVALDFWEIVDNKIWVVQVIDSGAIDKFVSDQLQERADAPAGDGSIELAWKSKLIGFYRFSDDTLLITTLK